MTLKRSSWHAWIYQCYYGFNKLMPESPWKYFLRLPFLILFIIPMFIIGIPQTIHDIFQYKKDIFLYSIYDGFFCEFWGWLFVNIWGYFLISILIGLVTVWIPHSNSFFNFAGYVGYVILLGTIIVFMPSISIGKKKQTNSVKSKIKWI